MQFPIGDLLKSSLYLPSSLRYYVSNKASLDLQDLKNYGPVSNLSFVSKLVERLAVKQLTDYLESNELMPPLQSAYRRHHSTETVITV